MTVRVGGQHTTNTFLERRCKRTFSRKYNELFTKGYGLQKNILYECNTVEEDETIQSGVNKAQEDVQSIVTKLLNVPAKDNVKLVDFFTPTNSSESKRSTASVLFVVRMNNQRL